MEELINNFVKAYEDLNADNLHILPQIYDENITFIDPFHKISGLSNLKKYFHGLYSNLDSCQFLFKDPYLKDNSAMIQWIMLLKHSRLSKTEIEVIGCTHIQFDQKIIFHRDYFDAGQMVYERVPLLGSAIKLIKRRINEK